MKGPVLPKSVVFLASVVTQQERWLKMGQLVKSIQDQVFKPDLFCVSIYVAPSLAISRDVISATFSGLSRTMGGVFVLLQSKPKKQFAQIYELCQRLKTKWLPPQDDMSHVWVTFTDDDDLWHPKRFQLFQEMLDVRYSDAPNNFSLDNTSGFKVITKTDHIRPNCCSITNPLDVDKAISCGCVVLSQKETSFLEYHMWMTKVSILLEFLEKFRFYAFENRYCDVLFSMVLNSYKHLTHGSMSAVPEIWTYFYRNGQQEYASVTNPAFSRTNETEAFSLYVDMTLEQLEIVGPLMRDGFNGLEISLRDAKKAGKSLVALQRIINKKRCDREILAKKYGMELPHIDQLQRITSFSTSLDWKKILAHFSKTFMY